MDAIDASILASIVTAVATVVLAVTTFAYMGHTRRMADTMMRQVLPDIIVSCASCQVSASFARSRNDRSAYTLVLQLWIEAQNRNSAPGSLERPRLFASTASGNEFQASTREGSNTIRMDGGDFHKLQFEFEIVIPFDAVNSMDDALGLLSEQSTYRISCRDNLGVDRGLGVPVANLKLQDHLRPKKSG